MPQKCPHCGATHPHSTLRCTATGLPIGGDPGLIGTLIANRYHLVRLLGDGGMGAVFKAADRVLRRFVAVKLLHPATAQNPSAVDRFVREARSAAAIGHPNIIDILDFGMEGERPYLVMEYLRGRSLSRALATDGEFSVERACSIATHTLAGLVGAHEKGILHRDLKPANLMLIAQFGDRDFVKICDFGFAALVTPKERIDDKKTLTPKRTLVGTPAYAAPERLRGEGQRDRRIDVYAVGVVLFEMLAGRRPFEAPTFLELARSVRDDPAPSLRQFRSDAPPGLVKVVAKALAKDPRSRWQSAEELAAALVPFGGRIVGYDDDEPSDSFTMDLLRIKARETQRRKALTGEHAAAVLAASSSDAARSSGSEHGHAPSATDRMPAVSFPVESEPPPSAPSPSSTDVGATALMRRSPAPRSAPPPPPRSAPPPPPRSTPPPPRRVNTPPRALPPAPSLDDLRPFDAMPPSRDTLRMETQSFPSEHAPDPHFIPPALAVPLHLEQQATTTGTSESDRAFSGRVAISVLRFVARRYGERALRDVLDAMPTAAGDVFRAGVEADQWVPYDAVLELLTSVDRELGRDDLHAVVTCGRAAAEGAFELMRAVLPDTPSPELLLAELPSLTRQLIRGVDLRVGRIGRGYGRVEVQESGVASLVSCVALVGYLDRSLDRFGAAEVEVNLLSCVALGDPKNLYDITWLA